MFENPSKGCTRRQDGSGLSNRFLIPLDSGTFLFFQANPEGLHSGSGGILSMPGRDGFSDGLNMFQGVRAYDPQRGSWTTSDAYAGNVHDPKSQKSYMWNNNNPVSYSDPSGYFADYFDAPEGIIKWISSPRSRTSPLGNPTRDKSHTCINSGRIFR